MTTGVQFGWVFFCNELFWMLLYQSCFAFKSLRSIPLRCRFVSS